MAVGIEEYYKNHLNQRHKETTVVDDKTRRGQKSVHELRSASRRKEVQLA